MNQFNKETRECIEACLDCHAVCYGMLMTHCLEMGGAHVRPQHVRLMMDCVEICKACADAMARKSQYQHRLCGLCADICDACAADCETLDGMEPCVEACRYCARLCRAMDVTIQSRL
jgi:hypothetical protein